MKPIAQFISVAPGNETMETNETNGELYFALVESRRWKDKRGTGLQKGQKVWHFATLRRSCNNPGRALSARFLNCGEVSRLLSGEGAAGLALSEANGMPVLPGWALPSFDLLQLHQHSDNAHTLGRWLQRLAHHRAQRPVAAGTLHGAAGTR